MVEQNRDGEGESAVAEEIEGGLDRAGRESDRNPSRLSYLTEREWAQEISLRQMLAEQEYGLRQRYADWILWLLGAQFAIADGVFVAFAWVGRRWDLPPGVIEVWLAATVAQVVGVVAVVTRHLFPVRDGEVRI